MLRVQSDEIQQCSQWVIALVRQALTPPMDQFFILDTRRNPCEEASAAPRSGCWIRASACLACMNSGHTPAQQGLPFPETVAAKNLRGVHPQQARRGAQHQTNGRSNMALPAGSPSTPKPARPGIGMNSPPRRLLGQPLGRSLRFGRWLERGGLHHGRFIEASCGLAPSVSTSLSADTDSIGSGRSRLPFDGSRRLDSARFRETATAFHQANRGPRRTSPKPCNRP